MSSQDFGLQQRKKPQQKITTPVIYETEEKVHSKVGGCLILDSSVAHCSQREYDCLLDFDRNRTMDQIIQNIILGLCCMGRSALWVPLNNTRKFAGYYIKHTFYFDVHPPLGKMLNAFAGTLGGFNGKFEFESGAKYPEEVSYGVMRFVNGLFGAFCTPLAYWTAIHLRLSHGAAILLAVMTIVGKCIFIKIMLGLQLPDSFYLMPCCFSLLALQYIACVFSELIKIQMYFHQNGLDGSC